MTKKEKIERRILWISFSTSTFFVLAEFLIAIYTGSQSVLMDAAIDASELLLVGLTLFLIPLFYLPASEKYPFGYAQIESILVIIKGFMLLSITLGLAVNSIEIMLSGGNEVDGGKISFFQFLIAIACLLIFFILHRMNRSLSSPIITVEIYGWRLDTLYSFGMAIAFLLSTFLDRTPLAFLTPYFDQVFAVFIVLLMLPGALKLLFRAIRDVFLFSPEQEIVDEIKRISRSILKEYQFEATFYEITRTGRRIWVSVYFQTGKDFISIDQLSHATEAVNEALQRRYEHCVCELIVDTPSDSVE